MAVGMLLAGIFRGHFFSSLLDMELQARVCLCIYSNHEDVYISYLSRESTDASILMLI